MSSAASQHPFNNPLNHPFNHQSINQPSNPVADTTAGLASESPSASAARSAIASSAQAADSSSPRPPKRPQLMSPPARPKPPKPAPEPEVIPQKPPEPEEPKVIGPISKPSERMQYRAIGLLKGKYVASEEQFNRGNILLSDETLIDSVLLGRVTSLIKKHIDLETEHLWVVYPRTLYKEEEKEPALHMQIVGVWEPETLNSRNGTGESEPDSRAPRYLSTEEAIEQCDRFSIRGEIAKYSEEANEITVNIIQKSKSENVKPKRPFKLLINGSLKGRTVGYFWDLQVAREGGQLKLEEATQVGVVPPKKRPKDARRKRFSSKPRSGSSAPKPMPKKKSDVKTHQTDSADALPKKAPTEASAESTKPKTTSKPAASADSPTPTAQTADRQTKPVEASAQTVETKPPQPDATDPSSAEEA